MKTGIKNGTKLQGALAMGVLGLLALTGLKAQAAQVPAQLPSGTQIKLELADALQSNKSKAGDEVVLYAKDDVLGANHEILIRKGAKALGKVTKAKGAGSFGRKGKLEFVIQQVEAADGAQVPLRTSIEKDGKGHVAAVIATTILISVIGAFIKGKNVTVPQGEIIDAYVDQNTNVQVTVPDAPKPATTKMR